MKFEFKILAHFFFKLTPRKSSLSEIKAFDEGLLSPKNNTNDIDCGAIYSKEQECLNFAQLSISSDNSLPPQHFQQNIGCQPQKDLCISLCSNSRKKKKQTIDCPDQSRVWTILKWHFSSGIRLKELASISIILSSIIKIQQPTRDERRSFPLLLNWFSLNWMLIEPLLPIINLRDSSDQIIDGRRELYESFTQ